MTENEVYKPNCCTGCTFADECFSETRIKCADYEIAIKEYNIGLAEGRKIQCGEQGKDGMLKPCEVMKENAEAKELLKTFLLIADKKVSQMEFQLCVADAKQFLNMVVEK